MKKPWRKISAQVVHKNPWWQVRADQVICPDGRRGVYYVADLRHFVSVFPLANDGKSLYLIRQWRYPIDQNSWESSQGTINRAEMPLAAAKRELREETGFTAKKWNKIGFSYLANGFANQAFYIYVARDLTPGVRRLESTEQDMIMKKFSFQQIDHMISQGIILDAPTIVSFYYLNKYLRR